METEPSSDDQKIFLDSIENWSLLTFNEENIEELQEDWGDEFKEVVIYLCGLHLKQYAEMFVQQGIDLDLFLNLNEDDLCHIGMTNSKDRATLLNGIQLLRKNRAKVASEVCFKKLSPEEVNSVLANTVKHLTTMHASLAHMRLNLQNPTVHNSLITFNCTSAQLLETLTKSAEIQAQIVMNQTKAVLSKNPELQSNPSKSRWKISLTIASSVGVVCAVIIYLKKYSNTS